MSAERIAALEAELAALRAGEPREPRRRRKAKAIEVFTDEQIRDILAEAPMTVEGRRFAAMVALLYASGLRIGEAVRLRTTSIEPKGNGVAIIHVPDEDGCKTGARDVPITLDRLEPYFSQYLGMRDDSEWLFSTYTGEHVHPNSFNRALKRYADHAGIELRVHAHLFRHTFATQWIANGGDPASLQAMLGHADPTMSLRYAHADTARLEAAVTEMDAKRGGDNA